MKRLFHILILVVACLPGTSIALTEMGADSIIRYSHRIVIARAQTDEEAKLFPAPSGKQRVFVEEVLKGIDTAQEFLVPENSLKPGAVAVVLPAGNSEYDFRIWPLDEKGNVHIGRLSKRDDESGGFGSGTDNTMPLAGIKAGIARSSPEETGLNGQLMDALLFPEKLKALDAQDPQRANYLRFVLVIYDMGRDVPALAGLLESRDKEVRAAAEARLKTFTGIDVPAPADDSPRALAVWSAVWAAHASHSKPPEWPPVPADIKMPADGFPEPLVKAVQEDDAAAFAAAFQAWLDSGILRDRQIEFAKMTLLRETSGNSFFQPDAKDPDVGYESRNLAELATASLGGDGSGIRDVRLPVDLVLNQKVPAEQRVKYMAMAAAILHRQHFIEEQRARSDSINDQPDGSETVQRAAFWGLNITRNIAQRKLAKDPTESSRKFLRALYLSGNANFMDREDTEAMLKAGSPEFIRAVMEYLKTHQDTVAAGFLSEKNRAGVVSIASGWMKENEKAGKKNFAAAALLCWLHEPEVMPVVLEWLKSKDDSVKMEAASCLCDYPLKANVPVLLAAANAEPRDHRAGVEEEAWTPPNESDKMLPLSSGEETPRQEFFVALSMINDERVLDPLIAELHEPMSTNNREYLVDGLGRVRDRRALPELAKIALHLQHIITPKLMDDRIQLLSETVRAFDYIQHREGAEIPERFVTSRMSLSYDEFMDGMARIKKWQKENAK